MPSVKATIKSTSTVEFVTVSDRVFDLYNTVVLPQKVKTILAVS